MSDLIPEGFVLDDAPAAPTGSALPDGFVLDDPAPATGTSELATDPGHIRANQVAAERAAKEPNLRNVPGPNGYSADNPPYKDGAYENRKQPPRPAPPEATWLTDLQSGWNNLMSGFAGTSLESGAKNEADTDRAIDAMKRAGTATPEQIAYLELRKKQIQQDQADAAQTLAIGAAKQAQLPPTPESVQRFNNATGWMDALSAFAADPYTISRSTILQSAPASIPSALGGIMGSILGPMGSSMGAGGGSYITELGGAVQEGLQRFGADMNDPASIMQVWSQHKAEISKYAQTRATVVGGADALTAGISSKFAGVNPVDQIIKGNIKRELLGTGIEATGGMAGEAGAQLATEGRINQPGQVLAEGLGEVVPGAVQVAGSTVVQRALKGDREAAPQPPPQQPQQPAPGKGDRIEPQMFPESATTADTSVPADATSKTGRTVAEPRPNTGRTLADDEVLHGAGYTPQQIAEMHPAEKAQEAADARAQGVQPKPLPPAPGTAPLAPGFRPTAPVQQQEAPAAELQQSQQPASNPFDQFDAASNQVEKVNKAPPVAASSRPRTSGYEGPNPDLIQNRIVRLEAIAADKSKPERVRKEAASRVADFRGYVDRREAMFEQNGTPQNIRDMVRGIQPDDVVTGTTKEGDVVSGTVKGWGRRGIIQVTDDDGFDHDIPAHAVTAVQGLENPQPPAGFVVDQPKSPSQNSQNLALSPDPSENAGNYMPARDEVRAPFTPAPMAPRVQTALYPPSQADKAFSTFFASKAPITPEALAKASGMPQKDAVKAIQRAALRGSIIQTRQGRWMRAPTRVKPISAMQFIASIGGISDPTGELAGMDLPKMGPYGPVVRKTGLHPDKVREALVEAGYLRDPGAEAGGQATTTVNDVYALLDNEMRGQKAYQPQDQASADALDTQAKNDALPPDYQPVHHIAQRFGMETWNKVKTALDTHGLDEGNWSTQELSDAARMVTEGQDPEDALVAAAIRFEEDANDPEAQFPEVQEWLQKRDPRAMLLFDHPPFPDVEPANAGQEIADGESPGSAQPVSGGEGPGTQEAVAGPREEASVPGQDGSEGQGQQPAPAVEQGADNKPQTVIPGAEQTTPEQAKAAAAKEKARKELEIRQRQSKMRKGGQQSVVDQEGGMFAGEGPKQASMLDQPLEQPKPEEKLAVKEPPAKIEDFGEKILGARKQAILSSRSLPDDGPAFAATIMQELAKVDDLFQNPRSDAKTLDGVIGDIVFGFEKIPNVPISEADRALGAVTKSGWRNEDGFDFFVLEDGDGQVWMDISNFAPGLRGSAPYAAVANYAHNVGKVFIGDPSGLSNDALRRRTEAMLSSAIKFGTTRHLEPHKRQIEGDPDLGIPPMEWTYGDDAANVASLINASIANTTNLTPEIANARFDFDTGTFRDAQGQRLSDEILDGWRRSDRRIREARASYSTIRRGIFLKSLAQAERGERPRLLEQALRELRQLVESGDLKATLYNRPSQSRVPPNRYRYNISPQQEAEITADIQATAKRILGRHLVGVEVRRDLSKEFSAEEDAVYDPNTGLIWVALQGKQNPRTSIRHEAIHALRNAGVFTKQEWAALTRMAHGKWIEQYDIRARYERLYRERFDFTEAQIQELIVEEAIAEGYAEHVALERDDQSVAGRIFTRLRRFLEAVRNMLAGRGFTSVDQIIRGVDEGQFGRRSARAGQGRDFLLYAKQPQQDRLSTAQSQDVTKTEAFRKWFGDSKVVDSSGKPMVMYHATDNEFDAFDTTRTKGSDTYTGDNWFGQGAYFSPSESDLMEHIGVHADDKRIIKAYLAVKNPYRWQFGSEGAIVLDLKAAGIDTQREFDGYVLVRRGPEKFTAWAKAQGYDGVIVTGRDGSISEVVAFNPSSIKSVFNRGTFDPNNQSILSSRGYLKPPKNPAPGSFDEPHDERVRRALFDSTDTLLNRIRRAGKAAGVEFVRKMQDREIDLKRTQNAIEKASGPIIEPQDAYLAASLYPGRVAQRDRNIVEERVKPLVDEIARRGLSVEDVDDFARAQHAFERNAYIASISKPGTQFHEAGSNPAIVGGSGLSDDQAQAILDDFRRSGKFRDAKAMADRVVAMNRETLNKLLTEGLIEQDTYDALTTRWKYYVPLRGEDNATSEDHPDSPRTGRRYDIRGKEFQSALGRDTISDSPLAYSIMQARQANIRIEKNRVGKRLLRLAQANPNEGFWQVNRRDMKRVLDKRLGYVRNVNDIGTTQAENVFAVKVGGKTYHITIHHEGLLKAMKGIGAENMHGLFLAFHKINRFLAALNTSYDPEFLFRNFVRDLQQTGIVLQEEQRAGLTRAVVGDIRKAAAGMNRMLQGDLSTQWARYAREYADAGGKMGFMDRNDIIAEKENIEKLMKQLTATGWKKAAQLAKEATFDRLERWNDSLENTLRLSTYVNLRRMGVSQDKAAMAARDLTVNFNRKGEWGPAANSLYLFFNASMQGAANMSIRLARSKRMRQVAVGIIAMGFLQDLINRMIAGDDDDDKNRYDKIPNEVKSKNGIIMMPKWVEDEYGTPYLKWPLPLGYNIFHYLGTEVGHAVSGVEGHGPLEAASNILGVIGENFNPLGQGGTPLNLFAPTLLDPVADIYTNKDVFGEDIVPKTFDEKQPWAERYNPNINWVFKAITDTLSSATGGSPERPGKVDWSPEWVEHVWDFAAGGVGRLVNRAATTAQTVISGDEPDANKMPFVRVFTGQSSKFVDRDAYYEIRDAVEITEKELKARMAEKDLEAVRRVRQTYDREIRMIGTVKSAEKQLGKLRKQYKAAKNMEGLDETARQKRLDFLSKRMDELQLKVRKQWNDLGEETTAPASAN